jgi:hypothetical protein
LEPDTEEFRDYFDSAPDIGKLEPYRSRINGTNDLDNLRELFEKFSPVFLPGYPDA